MPQKTSILDSLENHFCKKIVGLDDLPCWPELCMVVWWDLEPWQTPLHQHCVDQTKYFLIHQCEWYPKSTDGLYSVFIYFYRVLFRPLQLFNDTVHHSFEANWFRPILLPHNPYHIRCVLILSESVYELLVSNSSLPNVVFIYEMIASSSSNSSSFSGKSSTHFQIELDLSIHSSPSIDGRAFTEPTLLSHRRRIPWPTLS